MSDNNPRELEARIMKVLMPREEFKKFDRGETHSNNGVRTKKGAISALPNIETISEDDLPKKIEVQIKKVLVDPPRPSFGQIVIEEVISIIGNEIVNKIKAPSTRAAISKWASHILNDKVMHNRDSKEDGSKSTQYEAASQSVEKAQQFHPEISYQIETTNDHNERIIVTGEQAARLVEGMRQKAKEFTAFIYLLSKICIKDEKTDNEYVLEETCIKQLLSDEAQSTMRTLVSHRQLLEEDTALCLEEWLNGFIRNGDQRLPIPLISEKEPEQKELKQTD